MIKAACEKPSPAHWALTLYVNGPAGTANYTYLDSVNDNESTIPTEGFVPTPGAFPPTRTP